MLMIYSLSLSFSFWFIQKVTCVFFKLFFFLKVCLITEIPMKIAKQSKLYFVVNGVYSQCAQHAKLSNNNITQKEMFSEFIYATSLIIFIKEE